MFLLFQVFEPAQSLPLQVSYWREKKLRLADVKQMSLQMKDHA